MVTDEAVRSDGEIHFHRVIKNPYGLEDPLKDVKERVKISKCLECGTFVTDSDYGSYCSKGCKRIYESLHSKDDAD